MLETLQLEVNSLTLDILQNHHAKAMMSAQQKGTYIIIGEKWISTKVG